METFCFFVEAVPNIFLKKSFCGQIELYVNTFGLLKYYSQTQIQKNYAAVSQVTNWGNSRTINKFKKEDI